MCREGVHGCRAPDVAYWLADALWEVELDGDVVDTRHKVVGSRGRLVRAFEDYPAAVRELAEVGAWRSRDRAVAALRAAGEDALADRFAAASTLAELAGLGGEADESTFAGRAAALAADAAHFAEHGLPAQSPFVTVCSAGHVAAGADGDQAAYDAGYAAERAFQSAWLADAPRAGLTRHRRRCNGQRTRRTLPSCGERTPRGRSRSCPHRSTTRRVTGLAVGGLALLLAGSQTGAAERCFDVRGATPSSWRSVPTARRRSICASTAPTAARSAATSPAAATALIPTADTPTTGVVLFVSDATIHAELPWPRG